MSEAIIEAAVAYLNAKGTAAKPDPADVVAALVRAEKQCKRQKRQFSYTQLLGSWRLGFVSGTQTVRPNSGASPINRPGKGRFLPTFLQVQISYDVSARGDDLGTVRNCVTLGPARLQLSGPTRFWPKTNSLGFDFVHLTGGVGSLTLYDAPVRGGQTSADTFVEKTLKDQAFFTFFLVEPSYIAARGKGGGLALWTASKG